jgi:hypothetical protein
MSLNWDLSKPLVTMCDAATNEADKALWEKEDLGGIIEDNNRLPMPIVLLVVLTVITAFAVTFPLWGQRPTAAIKDDKEAMKKIIQMNKGTADEALLERHPVTMDDLRIIKPQIESLLASGVDMGEYEIVGDRVVMANFEGNKKADGTPERKQPWWDKGYLIDIFYLSYFFLAVTILIKRLPPSSWEPKHNRH